MLAFLSAKFFNQNINIFLKLPVRTFNIKQAHLFLIFLLFRPFGLIQKDQKIKTQQSSSRTRPDAGPLLRQPTAPFPL
jgi:hypothetical protein